MANRLRVPHFASRRIGSFIRSLDAAEIAGASQKAAAQFPFVANQDFDVWFEKLSTDQLDAMKQGVKQGVPLWRYFQLPRNDTSLGMFCLMRAGVKEASVLSYTIADARCRDYWRMRYWSGEDYPFDPTGQYQGIDDLADSWPGEGNPYLVETPSTAFRRDLHRRFFHLLRGSVQPYPPGVTAALANATVDPGDPQHIKDRIAALVAARQIAKLPPKDADLATRLMSWGEPDADEQASFEVTNTGTDQRPSITTVFTTPPPAYEPQHNDLPQLFALLDDERPTRWIDYQGSRTVGENALRAIAMILHKNPLELVDAANLEPWTKERRKHVNEALVKWWESHGSDATNEGTDDDAER